MTKTLSSKELTLLDAYWRAANYLSVGQIYLYDNPLLKKQLTKEHIKPRLLGHWGTTPGLNFIYAHLNRVIKAHDLDMLYITGPGHGGPGLVANAYLEGTYSEVYPNVSQDEDGMKRLFTQFSFPGGIPSHVAPETPGSIHEGGELGYAISHAYGAAFDNPDLVVACVIGDGEAETGPLATSWHSNKFLNPVTDGVVLPILHLNGYKIANPCVLARISHEELDHLFRGYGYTPHFVEGHEPEKMHEQMATTLDTVVREIQSVKELEELVLKELRRDFSPEFINRIDETIVFHKLTKEEILSIVELMMRRLREQMTTHEVTIELTDEAKELLVEKGYDPAMGARPLRRAIQRHIEDPLADFVLGAELTPGSTIMVDRAGDEEVKITIIPGEEREPVAVPAGDASEPEGSIDEPSDPSDD